MTALTARTTSSQGTVSKVADRHARLDEILARSGQRPRRGLIAVRLEHPEAVTVGEHKPAGDGLANRVQNGRGGVGGRP